MLYFVINGSSPHSEHVHRCSVLLISISLCIQWQSVAVQCWLTVLHTPEILVSPCYAFFTLSLCIQNDDVRSLFSESFTLLHSQKTLTMSVQSIGWLSIMVAKPANLSARSLLWTPAWPAQKWRWHCKSLISARTSTTACALNPSEPFISFTLSCSVHKHRCNPVIPAR